MKPRLQVVFGTTSAVLTSLALIAVLALVVLTTFIRREAVLVERAANDLHTVEAVRLDLLLYGRQSDIAVLSGTENARMLRDETEARLRSRLAGFSGRYVPDRQRMVEDARARIDQFVATRRRAESASRSAVDVIARSSDALEAALAAVERLAAFDLIQVENARQLAARWDRLADVLGGTIAGILLTSFTLVIWGMRRVLVKPLLAIHDAIRDFGAGTRRPHRSPPRLKELREIDRAFNDMADTIERNERERLVFLGGVAHDLKNPLTAMRLNLSLLRSGRLDEDKRQQKLMALDRQTARLERMLGDLVDASRIESGALDLRLEDRDLRALAQEIADLYSVPGSPHGIVIRMDAESVPVRCDVLRIGQVLSNLLSNAIKYSPNGGSIGIEVSANGSEGVVVVKDRGIGIPADDLAHIFDPFRRTGASKEGFPGVGLGLSVAKRIVEAHGGRIEVESAIGQGSVFKVCLPLSHMGVRDDSSHEHPPVVH